MKEPLSVVFARANDAAKRRLVARLSTHDHSPSCTNDSCPGNGFVTRQQLVEATLRRKGIA